MNQLAVSRRRFLQTSMVLGAGAASGGAVRLFAQEPLTASKLIAGKSDELEILGTSPEVLQSPVSALRRRITLPSELFVRNNQKIDGSNTLEPFSGDQWTVEFTGLLNKQARLDLPTLRSLPRTSVEMVLQCSGNRRKSFNSAAMTEGTQWGRGGIGNVVFTGVRLSAVMQHLGLEPLPEARFVAAEGKDLPAPGKADFEHSVPWNDIAETAVIALSLNGAPLPLVHGGPVRLVVPGYYATVCMKWLSKLRFESEESRNEHHAVRYRMPDRLLTPGDHYDYTIGNSVPSWRMRLATMTTSLPTPYLDSDKWFVRLPQGRTRLEGWAWNDGTVPITEVLYSADQGQTWQRTPFTPGKNPFAWQAWSAEVDVPKGISEHWIRAVDALGRTQPLDGAVIWTPPGYEWSGAERIHIQST